MSAVIVGGGFPSQVNVVQAPGVEGDFASTNPRSTVVAGEGAFVAGAAGVAVGLFAWADPVLANTLNNTGVGSPLGFIHRAQQGLITTFLAYQTMAVPAGLPVTAFNQGDFWVRNNGAVTSVIGMKTYALNNSGQATFNVTATPPTAASATAATLQVITSAATGGALPTTNTCTASIANNVMTVTAVGAGSVLGAGQTITGTGIDPAAVIRIISQLTVVGALGGTGTYLVSEVFTVPVASTTITMSGGGLTLTGANASGIFAIGHVITGTNIPLGTTITGYGTATAGGAGTYTVDRPAVTAATASTITVTNAMFLTAAGTITGTFQLNDLLTGASVVAGQSIVATAVQNVNLTGLGGAGTYLTNLAQTALTAQTIGVNAGTETTWIAMSVGAPGELVKIRNSANV